MPLGGHRRIWRLLRSLPVVLVKLAHEAGVAAGVPAGQRDREHARLGAEGAQRQIGHGDAVGAAQQLLVLDKMPEKAVVGLHLGPLLLQQQQRKTERVAVVPHHVRQHDGRRARLTQAAMTQHTVPLLAVLLDEIARRLNVPVRRQRLVVVIKQPHTMIGELALEQVAFRKGAVDQRRDVQSLQLWEVVGVRQVTEPHVW
mmetsp:Transcript_17846/g.57137  ORF Transcript_17846/g.57137 Transcript_17846/m.57137 type:complete len:200 (+) Transcript_17846:1444-2043(+)